jgi:S1-C subfamily serine protease
VCTQDAGVKGGPIDRNLVGVFADEVSPQAALVPWDNPAYPGRAYVETSLIAYEILSEQRISDEESSAHAAMNPMAIPASNDVFRSLDQGLAAAVATAAPSVVHVSRPRSGGTGIAWAPDLVVTSSFHTPDRTRVGIPTSTEKGDGELAFHDAEVIGRDPGTDLALLRVTGAQLTPATLRDLGGLAVGNLALAIGRPGRTARASLRAIGVLGPETRTPYGGRLEHYVESDRQIPRGFAGGPLIDADGAVIGMNTRTLVRGADLAVTTATLRRVVAELQAHGGVRRGYLGIGAVHANVPGHGRAALVASLDDGGPAATAGLLVGDVITALAGDAISGPDDLREAIGDRAGETVIIDLLRGGNALHLSAAIGTKS